MTIFAVPLLLTAAIPVAALVAAEAGPIGNAPTGTLTVTVEVHGRSRHVAPNKVEWHELTVTRRLELQLPMVRMATAAVGFHTSPKTQAVQAKQSSVQPSARLYEMQKAMDACEGDQQCLMQTGTSFALLMQQGEMDKPAAPPMADKDRFHHWAVDRRAACATGVIAIDDEAHGIVISPPSPAAPFRYRRSGERRLPAELDPVIEKVCSAMLAIDTAEGTLDIAVPGFAVPVELTYSGAFAGETGRSELFVEETQNGVQVGAVDLFDFPVDPSASEKSGQREVERIGQVTHAGGYGITPVGATVTWKFVHD